MSERRRLVSQAEKGLFAELGIQARLLWRLLSDDRVNPLLKLLPMASFLYLLFPFDLLGPIDDAIVIWVAGTLFIEFCPEEVVEEHLAVLEAVKKTRSDQEPQIDEDDIIDAKYSAKDES